MEQSKANFTMLVDKYIEARAGAWSETTLKKEASRLKAIPGDVVLANDGQKLFDYLTKDKAKPLKPYSTKTTFVRVGDFLQWAMEERLAPRSVNNVKRYMRLNARLFKRVYAPNRSGFTYEECEELIKQIEDEGSRAKAKELLCSGMRWEESFTLKDGAITGKGNAQRKVRWVEDVELKPYTKSYETFYLHLKKVGLKPHDLRKAYANRVLEAGAHLGELMAYMGWASAQTAASYVQSNREDELLERIRSGNGRKAANGK